MRGSGWVLVACTLMAGAPIPAAGAFREAATTRRPSSVRPSRDSLFTSPPFFEENAGQAPGEVQVVGRGGGVTAFLLGGGWVLADARGRASSKVLLVGSDAKARWNSESPTRGRSSYFLGNDPSLWRSGLPQFSRAVLRGAWRGIDAEFRGDGDRLAYGFRLAPGADSSTIRLSFEGAEGLAVDEAGNLVVSVPGGRFRHSMPVAWQEVEGRRSPVDVRFSMGGKREVGLRLGRHDSTLPVRIDPRIEFSSYLGGTSDERAPDSGLPDSAFDSGHLLAIDANGNLYVTGHTLSTNFPLVGAYQGTLTGTQDVFVSKIDPVAHQLVYSTYLGGPADDKAYAIAVDPAGEACVAGIPNSLSFPTTTGAFQTTSTSTTAAFVVKLASDGTSLVFSTYLGGGNGSSPWAIACDASGNVVVAGSTSSGYAGSTPFPTMNAIQSSLSGNVDAYIAKLQADGKALVFSTYYGGSADEAGQGLAIDASGAIYVAGYTGSSNFPTVSPLQAASGGGYDGFLLKLNSAGTSVLYSTYLGGAAQDNAGQVVVDATGAAFVGGHTKSSNFPVTTGAFQGTFGGVVDGFVAKVNPAGSALVYSTYLGGPQEDRVFGIGLGVNGAVLVSGETRSSGFPVAAAFQGTKSGGQDGFVSKLNPTGSALSYSSFIGGSGDDYLRGMAIIGGNRVCITGWTDSGNWPVSSAFQGTLAGGRDMLVAVVTGLPIAPSNLTATVQSSSRIDLTWSDNSNDETGFELQRKAGTNAWIPLASPFPNVTAYQDVNAVGSTDYAYRVRAVNDDGASAWSSEASGTTPPGPPGAPIGPGGVTLSELSPTQVLVQWEDRSDSEDFFQVNRKAGSGPFNTLATPGAGTTSYEDDGVLPDRSYTYSVKAGNVGGLSLPSEQVTYSPSPTLVVTLAKGRVKDSIKPGKDQLKLSGTLALGPDALSGAFNPMTYSLELHLNGWGGTTLLTVPAGDPGWKSRRGKWTWKTPSGSVSKALAKLDPATGAFSITLSKINFPAAPANPFLFSMGVGSDGGSTSANWTEKKTGLWMYP